MTEKLNISFFATLAVVIALPQQRTILKRVCRFVMPDLILLPALGCLWIIMLWLMVSSFLTTFIPSPCLPAVISTAINASKVSREYLDVAQALWKCPDRNYSIGHSLSIPTVGTPSEQIYASV